MNRKIRKLSLSRETVRTLADDDLRKIEGAGLSENPRICSEFSCLTVCSGLSDCCPTN